MRRAFTFLATAAFALSLAGAAGAESCKDAKGKFVKCPAPAAAAPTKAASCKDAKGKFTKCPAAAASPASAPPAPTKVASAAPAAGGAKKCVKGKACGNTCISVKDTCHK